MRCIQINELQRDRAGRLAGRFDEETIDAWLMFCLERGLDQMEGERNPQAATPIYRPYLVKTNGDRPPQAS